MRVNMGVGWHGIFMDVSTFAGLALGNEDARKVLTFNGLVNLEATTLDSLKEEINELIVGMRQPRLRSGPTSRHVPSSL